VARTSWTAGGIDVTRALDSTRHTARVRGFARAVARAADVPVQRDSAVGAALGNRPELRAELARAAAARQPDRDPGRTPAAAGAGGDYGVNARRCQAIATREVAVQVSVADSGRLRRSAPRRAGCGGTRVAGARPTCAGRSPPSGRRAARSGSAEAQQLVAREQLRLAGSESARRASVSRPALPQHRRDHRPAGLIRARDNRDRRPLPPRDRQDFPGACRRRGRTLH